MTAKSELPPNAYGYPDIIWERFLLPEQAGWLEGDGILTIEATGNADKAVLKLTVELDKEEGRVEEALFLAYGCPVTIAVGDWLAEWLGGRDLTELRLSAREIVLALEIPDHKTHCALMGEDIVRRLQEQVAS